MLKKLRIVFLTLLLCLSLLPIAEAASSKAVHIDSVKVDYVTLNVTVNGYVENYVKVSIPQHIMLSVTDNNGEYQQITEFEPERNGTFSYTYEHNQKNAVDSCTVTAKFLDSPYTDTAFYSIAGENQYEIFGNAIVFKKSSPTYFANGVKCETENVPYIENNEVFVPYTDEIKALGYECESEYIKLSEIENTYSDDEFFAIGEFDASVVNSIPVYFGIYVSSDMGSDNNSGLFNAPLKTIEKALEIRAASNGNPTIYLVGNEYRFDSTLSIDSSHSNLSVKAYPNTNPLIKKSVYLSEDKFSKITDEDSALFAENVKDNILVASFETIKSSLASYEYSVFDNNVRANNSRYPNGNSFTQMSSVADTKEDETEQINVGVEKATLWKNITDGRITVYRSCGYAVRTKNILSSDSSTGILTLDNTLKHFSPMGDLYFVENISKELDVPGEYYINPDKTKIYYYPKKEFNGLEITTDKTPLVEISGAQNITFNGISFSQSGSDLITVTNSDNIIVSDGELYSSKENGINAQKVSNCTFDNLIIYNTGSSGINLNYNSSTGSIYDLTHEYNAISNCDISDFGVISIMDCGIRMGGCGNTIKGNTIHNGYHQGIYMIGAENTIEGNDVYDACKLVKDAGIIYTAGVIASGNKIKNNIIHDAPEHSDWNQSFFFGVYLDNAASGVEVSGNYLYNMPYGIKGNGGYANTIDNNIMENVVSSSVLSWLAGNGKNQVNLGGGIYELLNNFDKNYDKEKWFGEYSYLDLMYKEIVSPRSDESVIGYPKNYVVRNNVIAGQGETSGVYGLYNEYHTESYNNIFENNELITLNQFNQNKSSYLARLNLAESGIISDEVKAFLLAPDVTYPYNNAVITEDETQIIWDKAKTADKYKVTVSKNADLSDPIYSEITSYNAINVETLDLGKYYYRIDGIRNAYNLSKTDMGEIRSFTIKEADKVSLEKISTGIENKVGAKIVLNVEEALSFDVIFAEKNDSGKVINVEIISKNNFTSASDGNVYYTMTDTKNKVEIFVWNGLTPLTGKNNLK